MTPAAAKTKNGIYTQIEQSLRGRIKQGIWPAGSRLPSRRDLAKEYGVSPITLDRAVSRLLAEGLLRADDRRGTFVANTPVSPAAQSLDTINAVSRREAPAASQPAFSASAATVGIVATLYGGDKDHLELGNFWVRLLLHSLEYALSQDGIQTQFFNRVSGPPSARVVATLYDALQTALEKPLDALVVIAISVTPDALDKSLSLLDGHKTPVVCITSSEIIRPVSNVFYDHRSAGYQAAQHLIQSGVRDIVYFAPFSAFWVTERLEGVQAAIEHANVDPKPTLRVFPSVSEAWVIEKDPLPIGYNAAREAFEAGLFLTSGNPVGVVCVSDGVAFGFLQAAAEAGKKAGVDYALISFDDHPDARTVGLTSLRPPMEAMGQEAARLLRRVLLHGEQASTQVRLFSHLLPRESTRLPERCIQYQTL